jgi:hypothetical protein
MAILGWNRDLLLLLLRYTGLGVRIRAGQRTLPASPPQERPASEVTDQRFQDQLISKLGELTGVALPES